MTPQMQKKLAVGQALIWSAMMLTSATIKIVLENTGRFTFGNITMFGPIIWMVFFAAAQLHLHSHINKLNDKNVEESAP